jgi:hypothetical protein
MTPEQQQDFDAALREAKVKTVVALWLQQFIIQMEEQALEAGETLGFVDGDERAASIGL